MDGGEKKGGDERLPSENGRCMTQCCLCCWLFYFLIKKRAKLNLLRTIMLFFALNKVVYRGLIVNRLHTCDGQRLIVGWSWGVVIFSVHCSCYCWLGGEARCIVHGVDGGNVIMSQNVT